MKRRLRLSPLVVLLAVLAGALWARHVHARTYTDDDVRVMKRGYERENGRARGVGGAKFPIEIMNERVADPSVVSRMLPWRQWEEEYRQYFLRHTGKPEVTLRPSTIVMHYTVCDTFDVAWNVFTGGANMSAGDKGTVWGHPSVHFMIDRDGTIYQLLPLDRRATGSYGVNHCALQIEMVATDEADLVNNPALMKASFRLVGMLTRRFKIPRTKVYGHYQVSIGKSVVPEYLDKADAVYPTSYPPSSARTDPGETYMSWLQYYLQYYPTYAPR